jgi:son of sevenless-like protein
MTVLELLTGEQPYKDFSRDISVLRELDQGKIPSRPDRKATERGLSDDLWALMKECWSKRPEKRPSVTTIKVKLAAMRGLTQCGLFHLYNCIVR